MFYFVVPPLYFWRALRKASADDTLFDPSFFASHGWLFEKYSPDLYWWELTLMARRMATALVGLFGAAHPLAQLALQSAVLLASAALQLRFRPYLTTQQKVVVFVDKGILKGLGSRMSKI